MRSPVNTSRLTTLKVEKTRNSSALSKNFHFILILLLRLFEDCSKNVEPSAMNGLFFENLRFRQ
jgi:hypothetical protein